jgi:hypothetical protein
MEPESWLYPYSCVEFLKPLLTRRSVAAGGFAIQLRSCFFNHACSQWSHGRMPIRALNAASAAEVEMATIIRFPAEAAAWRSQNRARDRGLPDGSGTGMGEIVMFTGIRYARDEDGIGNGRGARPGKRKRRAKG